MERKKKNGKKATWTGLVLGLGLIATSYFSYTLSEHAYLLSIQSEIAGAGLILTLLSGVFLFFNLRIRG